MFVNLVKDVQNLKNFKKELVTACDYRPWVYFVFRDPT